MWSPALILARQTLVELSIVDSRDTDKLDQRGWLPRGIQSKTSQKLQRRLEPVFPHRRLEMILQWDALQKDERVKVRAKSLC